MASPNVWCKQARSHNGTSGVYPTAPLFGRFIELADGRPKVLSGRAASAVLGAEYVYCYRATGHIGYGSEQYARSEIPIPIPCAAVRQDQPAAFDLLQHGVKALDNALQAMANVTELIDDVDDADKRSDNDKYLDRRYRKASAYEALDHLLTTALDKSSLLRSRLDDYLKASPELAHWLALWQAEEGQDLNPSSADQLAPVSVPGRSFPYRDGKVRSPNGPQLGLVQCVGYGPTPNECSLWSQMKREPVSRYASYVHLWFSR